MGTFVRRGDFAMAIFGQREQNPAHIEWVTLDRQNINYSLV
jgi:hypothetical protein